VCFLVLVCGDRRRKGVGEVVVDPNCKLSYPFKLLLPYQNLWLLRVNRATRSCLAIHLDSL
jgi:hypothetical protein